MYAKITTPFKFISIITKKNTNLYLFFTKKYVTIITGGDNVNRNVEKFDEIKEFDFSISYLEYYKDNVNNINVSHFHEECEVYINLSGDVDFMVEDKIYPINAGDIIITRPFEYHHCIYRSNKLHKHFWILFSSSGIAILQA